MNATITPKRATWKGHGKPIEILWFGAVAKRSEGVPATVAIEDGDVVIRGKDGGRLDWGGVASTFWAVPTTTQAADTHGHPEHDGTPGTCAACHAELFGIPEDDESMEAMA